MIVIDNILISDDLIDAPFECNLGACHGACCIQGDSGAPLDEDEIPALEAALKVVGHRLRPEAKEVISAIGAWEKTSSGEYAVTCVGSSECVFVTYDGPIAKCAIEQAHEEGKTELRKPISCHLYPVRIDDLGEFDALNYEQMDMCKSGVKCGTRNNIQLTGFLEEALTRKYGRKWVENLKENVEYRRSV